MRGRAALPLSARLSQALVAFTIEFDNEAEHRLAHRTTERGSTGVLHAPWLVSMAMWWNCMRFVGDEGVRVGELERFARTPTNLNGMIRWRYVVVAPDPADRRPKPPRKDWVIHATLGGRRAQEIWRPLTGEIEQRWRARFGEDAVDELARRLHAVVSQFGVELPDCLPILHYGLFSSKPDQVPETSAPHEDTAGLPLPVLLARAVLAFAIEYERRAKLSLAIAANVVRVLGEQGVRLRDLPMLAGISKEAVSMAMGYLEKKRLAVVEPDPAGSRSKIAQLTPLGSAARKVYFELTAAIEEGWRVRFGDGAVSALRASLESLTDRPNPGLEPYADGWRASRARPETLPHYPMVLHRGGFPDGS
jgi:DNA-binding MarR family transcriptional regulator